jgi:hypothetical protein
MILLTYKWKKISKELQALKQNFKDTNEQQDA